MPTLGSITHTLEAEVSDQLRQQSLIIWLDKDAHYTSYVDSLAKRYATGNFFAPVIPFRGSYLEMMLALEPYGNKEKRDILLVHMPGHTEDTIRQTPLLELYRAGYRYRKALDTLIREAATGKLSPDEIEAFINHGPSDLTQAEQWLSAALNQSKDNLSQTLIDLKDLTYILDELLNPKDSFKQKFDAPDTVVLLAQHLYRYTGMNDAFIAFYLQPEGLSEDQPEDQPESQSVTYSFAELSETFVAWLMCVEYVRDLQRSPHIPLLQTLRSLSKPLVTECDRLITYMRDRHPDLYENTAKSAQDRLAEEFADICPEDLGKIDTFPIEETTVFTAGALADLQSQRWHSALAWAQSRLIATAFWLQREPKRRIEWTLIQAMAQLGTAIDQQRDTLSSAHTLRDALRLYTESGYQVDLAHRKLEQLRVQRLNTSLPHFNELLACADGLRQHYRSWANRWAKTFANLCETNGFLPEPDLQQRQLYEQQIAPLLASKTSARVAYFLVDAFRYEMAAELKSELDIAGATVQLKARYAELPTLTSVGMNALAPVQKGGKLTLATGQFKGFKSGEYTVKDPKSRVRAMGDRTTTSHPPKLLTLAEVCEKSTKSLKSATNNVTLAVIHSKEIDDAGEANVGIVTFERWLQQIKSAWSRLKTLGFNEFIFTADHGFLLNVTLEEIPRGKKTDPKRRHFLLANAKKENGLVSASLNALGYTGQEGYLHFSNTVNPFATGKTSANFIHGGNSLQERAIPVLSVSHRHNNALNLVKYQIEAKAEPAIAGYSRLRVKVAPAATAQGILSFTHAQTINLSLRVPQRPDIDVSIAEIPGATLKNQQIQLSVEQGWVEVLFSLVGVEDDRVKVEVYQSDGTVDIEPALIDSYFEVSGSKVIAKESRQTTLATTPDEYWQSGFEDDNIRSIFEHIHQHGAITEAELNNRLGSPRKVRRFAAKFETYLQKIPFLVRVESSASGKRYVKDS